jgi:RNA polymerase sigma-54 factor
MSNRPALEIRHGQHLALTPRLQQSIRLLQLSSVELEMEISQALIENPLLERDDDPAPAAEAADPEREDSMEQADSLYEPTESRVEEMPGSGGVYPDDDLPQAAHADTLREHLLGQLALTRAQARDLTLVRVLIDELDDNGYLGSPLDEILTWMPAELEVDADELRAALMLLQSFDPPASARATWPTACGCSCAILTSRACRRRPMPGCWPARGRFASSICPCWRRAIRRGCAKPCSAMPTFCVRPTA